MTSSPLTKFAVPVLPEVVRTRAWAFGVAVGLGLIVAISVVVILTVVVKTVGVTVAIGGATMLHTIAGISDFQTDTSFLSEQP